MAKKGLLLLNQVTLSSVEEYIGSLKFRGMKLQPVERHAAMKLQV